MWKHKKITRPLDVQAAELAERFDGRPQVSIYPTMTGLSREQICQIAQSRGYLFQLERTEGISHSYQIMYFYRPMPLGHSQQSS